MIGIYLVCELLDSLLRDLQRQIRLVANQKYLSFRSDLLYLRYPVVLQLLEGIQFVKGVREYDDIRIWVAIKLLI